MLPFLIFYLTAWIVVVGLLVFIELSDRNETNKLLKIETMQEYCDRKFNNRG